MARRRGGGRITGRLAAAAAAELVDEDQAHELDRPGPAEREPPPAARAAAWARMAPLIERTTGRPR